MTTNKNIIAITAIFIVIIPCIYYFFMMYNNITSVSTDINSWGQFGSYFGGILSPITSLAAAYLIYDNLKKDMLNQKLSIIRDSISRIDNEIQRELDAVVVNSNFGKNLEGKKVIDIIRTYSELNTQISDSGYVFFFSQLDSIGIMCTSIDYYLSLLTPIETCENEIKNIEQLYWISKYSAAARRLIKILNPEYLEMAMKPHRLKAINKILFANNSE